VRADRLVAILLMLQSRGQVTAAEVAEELEVSERTARRDLEALGMAGVPVYSRQGRNGGWQLAGGGRTDLSGLNAAEARALFLVAGPSSSATPEVRAALRKLVRALPEPLRDAAEAASTAVVVDPTGWDQLPRTRPAPPHLDAVQQAVVAGQQVALGYVARDRAATTRVVHPLGLASKGSIWYLVAATAGGLRTFRVDRITAVEPTGEPVVRPEGFDLAEAWRLIADEVDQRRTPIVAKATAAVGSVPVLRLMFGTRLRIGPPVGADRVEVELRGHNVYSLAGEIAGFGAAVEVLDPPAVRERLAQVAAELRSLYVPADA
jgi:predicted DNA-binding transcriptional regulator YafY